MDLKSFFSKIERYKIPATILFRSIELKLLKQRLNYLFESHGPILDLGCGEGTATSTIFEKPIDYGLDIDELTIKQAEKSGIYKKVILADAGKIPLPNNSLGLIFCNCSLEHMENLDSVLKDVSRTLVNDGLFVFTTPSHNFKNYSLLGSLNLNSLAKIYGNFRDKRQHHYHSHSLENWSLILEKFNLKVTDGYYYLDKRVLEFWDLLLLLYFPFSLLIKLNPKFETLVDKTYSGFIYKIFFRNKIYQEFLNSKVSGPDGGAVCVIAKNELK